jgi:Na+/glutamate symporter
MELETIVVLVTVVVTFLCGLIAKKVSWFNNHLIPIQNIIIGVIVAIIEFIITKDFSVAIALSGLIAGGAYDIGNNLKKITNN